MNKPRSANLEMLFGGATRQTFDAQYVGKSVAYLPKAAAECEPLFSWGELNAALECMPLASPRTRLVGGNTSFDDTLEWHSTGGGWGHRVGPRLLHQALEDGATLVIDEVDILVPRIGYVARQLAAWSQTTVQVNLYASCKGASGFGAHIDDHDVYAVQLEGRKTWTLSGYHVPEPVEITMRAGDVLYLPQGTTHDVATHPEGSMHITFAVPRALRRDLLVWAANLAFAASNHDLVLDGENGRDAGPIHEQISIDQDLVDEFYRSRLDQALQPRFMNLPHAAYSEDLVDWSKLAAVRSPEADLMSAVSLDNAGRLLQGLSSVTPRSIAEAAAAAQITELEAIREATSLAREGRIRLEGQRH